MFSPTDTIVAIATPIGRGGIGVVRISGPGSRDIARAILATPHALQPRHATHTLVRPASRPATEVDAPGAASLEPRSGIAGARPGAAPGRQLSTPGEFSLRPITDAAKPGTSDEFVAVQDSAAAPAPADAQQGSGPAPSIDEVVATLFPAPHSYTTEDVVEISAHGSPTVLREIVRASIGAGARLAEPGEFTFRAYLGGRIDLVQAEAVGDLVDAVTSLQARVAFDQLEGTLTRSIAALDAPLFDLVAKLEASIDFPDEGYHFVDAPTVAATLRNVGGGIDRLLDGARLGRVIREGRQIAIVGKPNVGKSSLFNWLLGTDRAIVTEIPGTTRDLLRETVDFDGVRLSLVDTAGIRDVQSEIEREGVARARRVHDVADLVFVVLDASRPLEGDDEEVLARTAIAPRLVIVNKIDLPRAWNAGNDRAVPRRAPARGHDSVLATGRAEEGAASRTDAGADHGAGAAIEISLRTGAGLTVLRDAIRRALDLAEPRVEEPLVTNVRHEALLRHARESVGRALVGLEAMGMRLNEELVLADLSAARRAFDEVVGKRTSEDVLRAIFERFCVGK